MSTFQRRLSKIYVLLFNFFGSGSQTLYKLLTGRWLRTKASFKNLSWNAQLNSCITSSFQFTTSQVRDFSLSSVEKKVCSQKVKRFISSRNDADRNKSKATDDTFMLRRSRPREGGRCACADWWANKNGKRFRFRPCCWRLKFEFKIEGKNRKTKTFEWIIYDVEWRLKETGWNSLLHFSRFIIGIKLTKFHSKAPLIRREIFTFPLISLDLERATENTTQKQTMINCHIVSE